MGKTQVWILYYLFYYNIQILFYYNIQFPIINWILSKLSTIGMVGVDFYNRVVSTAFRPIIFFFYFFLFILYYPLLDIIQFYRASTASTIFFYCIHHLFTVSTNFYFLFYLWKHFFLKTNQNRKQCSFWKENKIGNKRKHVYTNVKNLWITFWKIQDLIINCFTDQIFTSGREWNHSQIGNHFVSQHKNFSPTLQNFSS